ncbi:hypothetical protein [Nocardioides sp. TF02-7]|uniref:hypothetical protein n=1 Tax=Nocardioides sp. TF02-7 TaxID=2917724 RepID=UPI001F05DF73|nr:hypothetical protein [Nocardioides sp. TF02-7]UMG91037.1 hypothetical protein MF408_12455 [Nocardioides sp. TF02-7]
MPTVTRSPRGVAEPGANDASQAPSPKTGLPGAWNTTHPSVPSPASVVAATVTCSGDVPAKPPGAVTSTRASPTAWLPSVTTLAVNWSGVVPRVT